LAELGRTNETRNELQTILRSKQELPWMASARKLLDRLPAADTAAQTDPGLTPE